jgi:uncharacterized tellurite resistance protein B-like protein
VWSTNVSIRDFLCLPEKHATTGDTETVRKVIEQLDQLEPERARFIAAFGYILGRVAYADMKISPEEIRAMERIIMERGGLPEEQAMIVVQTGKTRAQLFGGTENFLVTREFSRIATRQEKLALLDCLFAVAAAEDGISATEDNEIRQIVNELGLDHPDFIAVRLRWKDQLAVFKQG